MRRVEAADLSRRRVKVIKSVTPSDEREVSLEIQTLQPGRYVLFACTYYSNVVREFVLRIYTPQRGAVDFRPLMKGGDEPGSGLDYVGGS